MLDFQKPGSNQLPMGQSYQSEKAAAALPLSTVRPLGIGYCSTTASGPSSCQRASKGSWTMDARSMRSMPAFVNECIERCRQCDNCRYVSASRLHAACDWFQECKEHHLGLYFGGDTYLTFRVKDYS